MASGTARFFFNKHNDCDIIPVSRCSAGMYMETRQRVFRMAFYCPMWQPEGEVVLWYKFIQGCDLIRGND